MIGKMGDLYFLDMWIVVGMDQQKDFLLRISHMLIIGDEYLPGTSTPVIPSSAALISDQLWDLTYGDGAQIKPQEAQEQHKDPVPMCYYTPTNQIHDHPGWSPEISLISGSLHAGTQADLTGQLSHWSDQIHDHPVGAPWYPPAAVNPYLWSSRILPDPSGPVISFECCTDQWPDVRISWQPSPVVLIYFCINTYI